MNRVWTGQAEIVSNATSAVHVSAPSSIEIGVPVRVSSFCRIYRALFFSHYQLRIIAPF